MPQLDLTIEQLEAVYDTIGFSLALNALDEESTNLLNEIAEITENEMDKYNV